jgi:hypothetical protein
MPEFNEQEDLLLVTNEPVEVQDLRKITLHIRGTYRIYPQINKENPNMLLVGLGNTRISTDYA